MSPLQIVSLNVNGMRTNRKRGQIFRFLQDLKADIVLLQETHVASVFECVQWNRQAKCKGFWSVGTSNSRGVGILLRDPTKVSNVSFQTDCDGRIVVCDLTYEERQLRVLCLYAPTDGSERIAFFPTLDRYVTTRRSIILGGDLNCMLDLDLDKRGGNSSLGGTGAPHLRKLMQKFHLVDIWRIQHPTTRAYTWHDVGNTVECRLDRFYVSGLSAKEWVVESGIHPCHFSDHDAIVLVINDTKNSPSVGSGVWKLNTSLLKSDVLAGKLQRFWKYWRHQKASFASLAEWWDAGKVELKDRVQQYGRQVRKTEREHRASIVNRYRRLATKPNLSPLEVQELTELRESLSRLDEQHMEGCKIRSRAKAVQNGEKPSRYFFQREHVRGKAKIIKVLKTPLGRVHTQAEIMHEQVRFYEALFSSRPVDRCIQDRLLQTLDRKLSDLEREMCEGPLTEAECLAALRSSGNNKSPGLDGFPKEFYLTYWEIIGADFVEMANCCLAAGKLPQSLRRAIITLIFKKEDPEELKNWRPISLLTADYKIIAKVLANRLKNVMKSLIHPDQTCSVPGRSSEDNATLLRDISDYVASKNMTCAFLAIDQEKAFDSVDWGFMHRVLDAMNFGPCLRGMVECLYTDIQSAILSNGHLTNFFDVHRGVRQGCPLSPILFVLLSEVFGQAVRTCQAIEGIKLPGGRTVKIAQYADDNTCIATTEIGIHAALEIFETYGAASGAKLNASKTKGLWMGRWRGRMDRPGGLEWLNTNIKILGYYFGNFSAPHQSWDAVITKYKGVLLQWTTRFLTLRGKAVIFNTLAASKVWHLAKIYPPTRMAIDNMTTALWKFLWSGKPELVRREICMSDHAVGGLRVTDIALKCKCLLIARAFKFFDQNDAPWKSLMQYYAGRSLGVNDNNRPNSDIPSSFYNQLLRVLREYTVDLGNPQPCKFYYIRAVRNQVTPVKPTCQEAWDREYPSLNWKEIWKTTEQSYADPLLKDFIWRTIHRVLPVNVILHRWNSRWPLACARCNNRRECLSHTLVHCPKQHDLWMLILSLCNKIDATITGFTEEAILLGNLPVRPHVKLCRYLIAVGKFAAWKERVSYQYSKDTKINSETYFRSYVRNRLKIEQSYLDINVFNDRWCVNKVLASVFNEKVIVHI